MQRVEPPRPDLVAKALPPDYALGAHVAALGLAYSGDNALPDAPRRTACSSANTARGIAKLPAGYKVVFVPFADGKPTGLPHRRADGFREHEG